MISEAEGSVYLKIEGEELEKWKKLISELKNRIEFFPYSNSTITNAFAGILSYKNGGEELAFEWKGWDNVFIRRYKNFEGKPQDTSFYLALIRPVALNGDGEKAERFYKDHRDAFYCAIVETYNERRNGSSGHKSPVELPSR